MDNVFIGYLTEKTRFFVFDTAGTGKHGDVEFNSYDWSPSRFNKVSVGDLFIYRRPSKYSETKRFYFFGAGQINSISEIDGKRVRAKISSPIAFENFLTQDYLADYEWAFKPRDKSWERFFNQYGMTEILQSDFFGILSRANVDFEAFSQDEQSYKIDVLKSVLHGNYRVEDNLSQVKTRINQKRFSDNVKFIYNQRCAVTGISNSDFLIGSHIIPWAENKDHRLDPQNGICLSVLIDKAFDKGYISFTEDYRLLLSDKLKDDNILYQQISPYEGKKISCVKGYEPKVEFLRWHYERIFKK